MISQAEQQAIIAECEALIRAKAPNPVTRAQRKSTGNLASNAVQSENESPGVWVLYVDESIAPYMPYTNEPWLSERWHGKKNPNEGWFDRLAKEVMELIATRLGGRIEEQ
jgi:hypothetical protein